MTHSNKGKRRPNVFFTVLIITRMFGPLDTARRGVRDWPGPTKVTLPRPTVTSFQGFTFLHVVMRKPGRPAEGGPSIAQAGFLVINDPELFALLDNGVSFRFEEGLLVNRASGPFLVERSVAFERSPPWDGIAAT